MQYSAAWSSSTLLHAAWCYVSYSGCLVRMFCPISTRFWRVFGPFGTLFWIDCWGSSSSRIWSKLVSIDNLHCLFSNGTNLARFWLLCRKLQLPEVGQLDCFLHSGWFFPIFWHGFRSAWINSWRTERTFRRRSCLLRKSVSFSETHGTDWEDDVRKGGTPNSRYWQFSSSLAYFRRISRLWLT